MNGTNNSRNAHHKYLIRGFKRHLPYAVAAVIFFVMLLHRVFEKRRETKMKLKVSGESTEQNNGGIPHRKYAIRGSNGTYPPLFLLLLFSCLSC